MISNELEFITVVMVMVALLPLLEACNAAGMPVDELADLSNTRTKLSINNVVPFASKDVNGFPA